MKNKMFNEFISLKIRDIYIENLIVEEENYYSKISNWKNKNF